MPELCFKSVEERFHVSWKISLSLERPVCKVGLWLATKSLNLWRTPHYFVTRRWGSLCLSCSYKHYNAIHSGQLKILTKKHCGLLGTLGYPSGTWNLFMCQTGVPAWPVPRRYSGWCVTWVSLIGNMPCVLITPWSVTWVSSQPGCLLRLPLLTSFRSVYTTINQSPESQHMLRPGSLPHDSSGLGTVLSSWHKACLPAAWNVDPKD